MRYRQAAAALARRGNEVLAIHLGLGRMRAILDALGNPERLPAIVHVAGTNGKGSTAAMAQAILAASGRRTGLYTSPHLERLTERIRVGDRDVGPADFGRLMDRVARTERALLRRRALDRPLTYFEALTAVALCHFAAVAVEAAVIEVGLGGRLDATNLVHPAVCAITTIGYDHQELLGSTLAAIAGEKAGIVKPGVPVVSGCRGPAALRVLRAAARAAGAPLVEIDRDCRLRIRDAPDGHVRFDLDTPRGRYRDLRAPLRGEYQARNAAVAIAAVEELEGAALRPARVRRGLAATRWPGRLEEFHGPRRTLLDGAHNAEGAAGLAGYLRRRSGPLHLVFGALADKAIGAMAEALFPLADAVYLTPVPGPRGAHPEEIAARSGGLAPALSIWPSARAALDAAWRACPRSGLVVVAGSLYLAGALRPVLRRAGSRSGSKRLPSTSRTRSS